MSKVFAEGSKTVEMLATARTARGDVFADTLKDIAVIKEACLQGVKDGKDEAEILAGFGDRPRKIVDTINEHNLDKSDLFLLADCLLAVVKVEGLRDEEKEADDVKS